MKIKNNDKLVIYLTNNYLNKKNIDVNDIENCFYKIFDILKEKYQMKFNGLYDVNIYIDLKYGIVIELIDQNFNIDYYNQIDMQIKVLNTEFLLKINDLEPFLNSKIYKYNSNYYSDDLKKIEFGELIYNTDKIISHAVKVEI